MQAVGGFQRDKADCPGLVEGTRDEVRMLSAVYSGPGAKVAVQ